MKQVLATGLATLLAQQNGGEHRAFAMLLRSSPTRTQRQRALTAINRLLSAIVQASHDLGALATGHPRTRTLARLRHALAAWQAMLVKQRRVVRARGRLDLHVMRALSRQEASDASAAMRVVTRLRSTL